MSLYSLIVLMCR